MGELTPQERLQPSLLDRLTDEDSHNTQESRDQRVFPIRRLREFVLRDLAWLLNTTNLESAQDLSAVPAVAASVLNYGVPDLTGRTVSGLDGPALERLMIDAIRRFEPRVLPQSLRVRVINNSDQMNKNALCFEIEGDLWNEPLPLRLYLKTDIDLETGHTVVAERGYEKPKPGTAPRSAPRPSAFEMNLGERGA